jgi:activating signal cointegrator complex subunit 3
MLPPMNDDILDHLKSREVSIVPSLLYLSREELCMVFEPFSAAELCQMLLSQFSYLIFIA